MHWLRMPLPFALDHINLWLLEDEPGLTLIDCGIASADTRALWERLLAARRGVGRVLITHCHPDHAGNAGWLCKRTGAGLWATQAEYLTAHAFRDAAAGYTTEALLALFRRNGLDGERHAMLSKLGNRYRVLVPEFPLSYRRYMDGERIAVGGRHWRALVGYGHAPEHASLYCEELKLVISGDMLLPSISTNVSVWPVDPEGDPLRLFLDSIRRYRELPPDTLVLPSHGLPFRGAHARVAQLEAHHEARLAELVAACAGEARSAADLLGVLFRRRLDMHQIFFAMGEAIAHLHYLRYSGRARRDVGADGIVRYTPLAEPVCAGA